MANEYQINIQAQPYFKNNNDRTISISYSIPEKGTDSSTGILLIIPGYEGDTSSNVFKKMRREFSDRKNLITIQCDYFGIEFMGSEIMSQVRENFNILDLKLQEKNKDTLTIADDLSIDIFPEETPENFCESGIFQALDCLKGLLAVMHILNKKKIAYNKNNISAYGFSHGGYLSMLCNAFAPNLFSTIIDNSGLIYPTYLYRPRICSSNSMNPQNAHEILFVKIHYRGLEWIDDIELYHLRQVYKQIESRAQILTFHGQNDKLITLNTKKRFLKNDIQI